MKKASLYRDHRCLPEKRAAFPGNSATDDKIHTQNTDTQRISQLNQDRPQLVVSNGNK